MSPNEHHNQPDQHIDTVLDALRHAEPNAAMQDRLLATLRHAGATQSTSCEHAGLPQWHWRTRTVRAWRDAAPWLVAAALLCAAGGTLRHHLATYRMQQVAGRFVLKLSSHRVAHTQQDSPVAGPVSASLSRPVTQPSNNDAVIHAARSVRAATAPRSAPDASMPPPPLPLTEQELLLLRLARHEPTQQLAQLTEPARNSSFQRDKAAVSEFFAPLPPLRSQQEPPGYDQSTGQQ